MANIDGADATDEFLPSSNTNANVGQAVAQQLATAARTVTIVVNGVDSSGYLDHAPSSNRVQKPRPGGEKGKRLERWAQVFASEFCCEAWH
jgi:hypothetical protein